MITCRAPWNIKAINRIEAVVWCWVLFLTPRPPFPSEGSSSSPIPWRFTKTLRGWRQTLSWIDHSSIPCILCALSTSLPERRGNRNGLHAELHGLRNPGWRPNSFCLVLWQGTLLSKVRHPKCFGERTRSLRSSSDMDFPSQDKKWYSWALNATETRVGI